MKRSAPIAAWLVYLAFAAAVQAGPNLNFQKLYGRWNQTPTNYFLGYGSGTVAINEKWIAAGADSASEQALNQGAVQIFNATTGAWVRKLLPPTSTANQRFGSAVLLSGDLVAIGARGDNSTPGQVFVFNAATGKLIRSIVPSNTAAGDFFGYAMAVEGDLLAVSAYGTQKVWLFSFSTGAQHGPPAASDVDANSQFGISVSLEGDLLLVGAPTVDSGRGAGYLFSVANPLAPVQLSKIIPTGSLAGDNTGVTVALHRGRAIMGCQFAGGTGLVKVVNTRELSVPVPVNLTPTPGTTEFGIQMIAANGKVASAGSSPASLQLFEMGSGTVQQVVTPPDLPSDLGALAMSGSSLVVGDPFNDDQASNNGSLYLIQKVALPLPFETVAAKGDSAPGTLDTTFASFSEVDFNGALAFSTGLAGPGSGGGKDKAIWRDNGNPERQMKSRTPLLPQPAPTVASVSMPLLKGNDSVSEPDINETVVFRAMLSGNGVTPQSNQAIFRALIGGTDPAAMLFRTGTQLPTANGLGRRPLGFGQLSVPQTRDQIVFAARQAPNPAPLINASNDSALFWYDNGNVASLPLIPAVLASLTVIPEGNGTPLGIMGEPTGHFAFQSTELLFSAALANGIPAQNQGLFRQTSKNPASITGIATKGLDEVPDSGGIVQAGITFSSFLAESLDGNENGVVRAMIQGPGITKANNEGLWKVGALAVGRKLAQKGNLINGATVAGFKAFWSTANQCLIWLKLSGTGVTAANNEALVVVQTGGALDGEPLILLRKGDFAPGYSPAKIGNILAVEVEPNGGQYIVLTTLTGAPANKNLALFRGQSATTAATVDHAILRKPVPVLRKGDLFDNQPSPVKSISISTNSRTPGGAGCVGLASTINGAAANNPAKIAFVLTYENGNTRLVRGQP